LPTNVLRQVVISHNWFAHEEYFRSHLQLRIDIGLVLTDWKFNFDSEYVGPVVIANKKEELQWKEFKLYGWGSSTCDLIPYKECRLRYGYLHMDSFVETQILFDYKTKTKGGTKPICLSTKGDSGGPITQDGILHALAATSSRKNKATINDPCITKSMVTTRIKPYVDNFVQRLVKENTPEQTIQQNSEHENAGFMAVVVSKYRKGDTEVVSKYRKRGFTRDTQKFYYTRCSGAFLAGDFVIVAGHCVEENRGKDKIESVHVTSLPHSNYPGEEKEASSWHRRGTVAVVHFRGVKFQNVKALNLPKEEHLKEIHKYLTFKKARLSHFNPLTGDTTFREREEALKGNLVTAEAEFMDVDGAEVVLKVPGGFTHHSAVAHYEDGKGEGRIMAVELERTNKLKQKFAVIDRTSREWVTLCAGMLELAKNRADWKSLCD